MNRIHFSSKKFIKNSIVLLLGLEFTAFGTILLKIGNLGMNSLSTLPTAIHAIFPFLSFGNANLLLMILSVVVLVLFTHQMKSEYLFCFISSILYSVFVDITGMFFSWHVTNLYIRICIFTLGLLFVSLGIYFQKETELPSTPFNIFCKEIAVYEKKTFSSVKGMLDISFVSITILLECVIGNYTFVGIGTILCAIFVSRLIYAFQFVFPLHK